MMISDKNDSNKSTNSKKNHFLVRRSYITFIIVPMPNKICVVYFVHRENALIMCITNALSYYRNLFLYGWMSREDTCKKKNQQFGRNGARFFAGQTDR